MSTPNPPKYEVVLGCGHKAYFRSAPPEQGAEQYCMRCQDYTFVITDIHDQYRYKCDECVAGRKFGEDKDQASRAGSRHSLKYGHIVSIKKGDTTITTIGVGAAKLPFQSQVEERRSFTRGHQQGLRDSVTRSLPS